MPHYSPVIGLEIHARLMTRTKLFCTCPTSFGAPPNSNVCPVCLGYPGALPVLNETAVELAVLAALAANCSIERRSVFARKNYFYPDLPKGYQISQSSRPLATGGHVTVGRREIRIQRIHIEEDAGKLIHREGASLVDLNRAGTPLIEIVSEPEIESAEEAAAYFARIRQLLMYAGVCDGNMEEGSLRCDANVSVRREGEPLGTRTEVKNVNSFRYVARAIAFEIERQTAVLESGGRVVQETRLYDAGVDETRPMRSKEEAHDYRYFDEPDLPPLLCAEEWVEKVRSRMPEMPDARSRRYQSEWAIPAADADALTATRELAEWFEQVARASENPRASANWVRNEVLRIANEQKSEIDELRLTPAMLSDLIRMLDSGAIGGKAAKEVFDEIARTGEAPAAVVERRGLVQISDPAAIREAALRVLARSEPQAAQYRSGRKQLFGFFVGQLMKETGGKANAEIANAVLRELLD